MEKREIKFRCWAHGRMLSHGQLVSMSKDIPGMLVLPIGYELMQFTGLRDRNGTEIYEGDVVVEMVKDYDAEPDENSDYPMKEGMRDVVTMARFPVYWLEHEQFGWEGETLVDVEDCEVIGNIYENPELVKQPA